jgi:hypothetical protein
MESIWIYTAVTPSTTTSITTGEAVSTQKKDPTLLWLDIFSNNLLKVFKHHDDESNNNKKTYDDSSRLSSLREERHCKCWQQIEKFEEQLDSVSSIRHRDLINK